MAETRRNFVKQTLALLGVTALAGCVHGEDPTQTKRFAAFLSALLAGKVQSGEVDDKMREALTPDRVAGLQQEYAHLGRFEGLQFVGQDALPGYRRYYYAATFSAGKQGFMFVLDSEGKIAGFFEK